MNVLMNYFPNYNKRMVLRVSGLSSSTFYDNRKKLEHKSRPGPKPKYGDQEILKAVSEYLKAPMFYLEGYKKIHKRLVKQGFRVAKERLRRIMSEAELLCHQSTRRHVKTSPHDGTITTDRPNELWGMDIKEFKTAIGKIYFMGVIDHFNSEIKGWYMSNKHTHVEVMQALRNAVHNEFGKIDNQICKDAQLSMRVDHGSEFDSKAFERELLYLGVRKSSAFVRSPECNGVIERFHRTLKEQLVDIYSINDLENAKQKIEEFIHRYNEHWFLHRLGLESPIEYRQNYLQSGNTELKGVRH